MVDCLFKALNITWAFLQCVIPPNVCQLSCVNIVADGAYLSASRVRRAIVIFAELSVYCLDIIMSLRRLNYDVIYDAIAQGIYRLTNNILTFICALSGELKRCLFNVMLLDQRRRRWTNINPTSHLRLTQSTQVIN